MKGPTFIAANMIKFALQGVNVMADYIITQWILPVFKYQLFVHFTVVS